MKLWLRSYAGTALCCLTLALSGTTLFADDTSTTTRYISHYFGTETIYTQSVTPTLPSGASATVSATVSTTSGGSWLGVDPQSGKVPGTTFTISIKPAGLQLGPGVYQGLVKLKGSSTTELDVQVTFTVCPAPQIGFKESALQVTSRLSDTYTRNLSVRFTISTDNGPTCNSQSIGPHITMQTDDGGTWLELPYARPADMITSGQYVMVNVKPAGLAPGDYHGSIIASGPGFTTATVPVTLHVVDQYKFLLSQTSVHFDYATGAPPPAPAAVQIASNIPADFSIRVPSDCDWLTVQADGKQTPAVLTLTLQPQALGQGQFHTTLQIASSSIPSPATVDVTADLTPPGEPWQYSWDRFTAELAKYLAAGSSDADIRDTFAGRTVNWQGSIERNNDPAGIMRLNMSERAVKLASGADARLHYLDLAPEAGKLERWKSEGNASVRFRAVLGAGPDAPLTTIAPESPAGPNGVFVATTNPEVIWADSGPVIERVVNANTYLPIVGLGSWVSIQGRNLNPVERLWRRSDFSGNYLPAKLDGVWVEVNNSKVPISYIGPDQINFLLPLSSSVGDKSVRVFTPSSSNSGTFTATLYQPAFGQYVAGDRKYTSAQNPDGTLVGPPGALGDTVTHAARPGDTIVLTGSGFGQTNPSVFSEQVLAKPLPIVASEKLSVRIGGVAAEIVSAMLVDSGVYQIQVVVPRMADGDQPVVADMNGQKSPADVYLTVSAAP